jgi:signal transduction histidine kinase/DNA-binding response OmpR family regulator
MPFRTREHLALTTGDPPAAADAGAVKANILVVDDRPENLLVFKTTLDDLEQNVVTARSGEEALKRLLELDFAVILLDVNMPGMDGLETATYIRGRQKTARTPIIFLTAYVEEMHTAKGYLLGAVDYMLTPVMPDILRTKVRVFVELYLMTRQVERQADQRIALAREQAARAAAEEAIRRSTFLAEAGDILSSSLDVNATVRALAQFTVPYLGELSALTLADEQGRPGRSEIAWISPRDGVRHSESAAALDNDAISQAMKDALDSGNIAVLTELNPGHARLAATRVGQEAPTVLELGFTLRSLAVFPLVARGRKLGTFLLGLAELRFEPATLTLAEDLTTRAAVSLDNCLLYARIQEADQRKNEFLAMLAHELRNPLAPVRNAVQILRMPNLQQAKLEWGIEVIDRQSKQLVRLVDDLLDVARITQGRISLKLESVDVAGAVAAALEMSRPFIDARSHELAVTMPSTPLRVYGDYSRIAQILANLLNNAAKYTEPNGRISLSAVQEGAEVVFRVRDSGIGIRQDMLASVFELFTQADRSLDRSQGGLGIGLTVVQRLVSMQNGSVQAFSAGPGKGSEFVVRLPRLECTDVMPAHAGSPRYLGMLQRVLVVDDYVDSAESMAMLLQAEGHEVRIAHEGMTAIKMAADFRPGVIFLDIGLPGMNGFEVARRVREMPETTGCVLVAMTGYGQAEDHRRSMQSGFDHHFVKPVDPSALQELFKSLEQPPRGAADSPGPAQPLAN